MAVSFRCVLNWFGDWSTEALYQVGKEFTSKMDLEKPNYIVPDYMPVVYDKLPQPPSHREAIVNSCVFVHQTLHQVSSVSGQRVARRLPSGRHSTTASWCLSQEHFLLLVTRLHPRGSLTFAALWPWPL